MRYFLAPSGAGGHESLRHAKPKPGETTDTDRLVKQYHDSLGPDKVNLRLPPRQKLAHKWPQLQYGAVPHIDPASYKLTITLNGQPVRAFTLSQLEDHPARFQCLNADFHCVTGWSVLGLELGVIPITNLLDELDLLTDLRRIISYCADDFSGSFDWNQRHKVYVCTSAFGRPLEPKHGFPVRLMIPSTYGFKSAKWVHTIDLTTDDRLGFWEIRGYDDHADPWLEERFAGRTGADGLTAAQRAKHALNKRSKS